MFSPMQHLENTHLAMAEALKAGDWERIAELDHLCREQVTTAMLSVETDQQVLRESFKRLLDFYALMLESCKQQRSHLGNELLAVNRGNQGAKVYQMFG
jgi:flagellar protein FliT